VLDDNNKTWNDYLEEEGGFEAWADGVQGERCGGDTELALIAFTIPATITVLVQDPAEGDYEIVYRRPRWDATVKIDLELDKSINQYALVVSPEVYAEHYANECAEEYTEDADADADDGQQGCEDLVPYEDPFAGSSLVPSSNSPTAAHGQREVVERSRINAQERYNAFQDESAAHFRSQLDQVRTESNQRVRAMTVASAQRRQGIDSAFRAQGVRMRDHLLTLKEKQGHLNHKRELLLDGIDSAGVELVRQDVAAQHDHEATLRAFEKFTHLQIFKG